MVVAEGEEPNRGLRRISSETDKLQKVPYFQI